MAQIDVPKVPIELWRELLEQLVEFRRVAPWEWMPDSAIGAYVDSSGQPWFSCVLGNARQVFGLALYRGANGLRVHRLVRQLTEASDMSEVRHMQDALTVYYGPKAAVHPAQRLIYEKLGYAPKRSDRLAWPDVRSHRPGYFPWHPEADEVSALTGAISSMLRFAEFYREHPDCFEEHGRLELPTLPDAESPIPSDGPEWRTWLTPAPNTFGPPAPVDPGAPAMRRVAKLPQADEAFEVDWFYTPEAVVEDGRPFYPRGVVVFQASSGFCFGAKLIAPDDDVAVTAADLILDAIEQHGCRPKRISATKEELTIRLEDLARSFGAHMELVPHLAASAEFRTGLEADRARGARRKR